MIELKSPRQIAIMHQAGQLLAGVMDTIEAAIAVGVTTQAIDKIARDEIKKLGGIASFMGYNGFPASLCASVNEQVVHGIPGGRKLENGDIIGIDIGMIHQGYHADMARTFGVGTISPQDQRLIEVTRASFWAGFHACRVGNRIGDIGAAVQGVAEEAGYGVVRELTGHGIGTHLHEEPEVPNFGKAGHGARIEPGLVIAVEPMINQGTWKVDFLADGWTTRVADGSKSAHYENTIAVTKDGPVALTLTRGEVAM